MTASADPVTAVAGGVTGFAGPSPAARDPSRAAGDPSRAAGERPPPAPPRELPCRSAPELFFAEAPQDLRQAQALCQRCPVRQDCLAGALRRGEPWGVWGGELLLHGAVIAGKRARGRPRKTPIAA